MTPLVTEAKGWHLLSWLIPQTTLLGEILAAIEGVTDQCLPTKQATRSWLQVVLLRLLRAPSRFSIQACLDQRPTPTNPMAVATIHKLVGATGKSPLWGILPG